MSLMRTTIILGGEVMVSNILPSFSKYQPFSFSSSFSTLLSLAV